MKKAKINQYANTVCYVTLNNGESFTTMVHHMDFAICDFGHPMYKDGHIPCGCDHSIHSDQVCSIVPATAQQCKQWESAYHKFSKEIIAEKGYDACDEDLSSLLNLDSALALDDCLEKTSEIKKTCLEHIEAMLKKNGHDPAHHLALTEDVDCAYGPKITDEELQYDKIGEVWLNERDEVMFSTEWDKENMIDPEDAEQFAIDVMSACDLTDLLASVLQQINLNHKNGGTR